MLVKSLRSILVACLIISAICESAQADIVEALCPAGYQYIEGKCYSSSVCPEGHYLNKDGKCYPQTNKKCPPGYFLNTDELCYRTNPEPCPFETTTTTTEPTTTTTTTTEPSTTTTTEPTTTTTTTEPTTTTTTTEPTTTTTTTTTEPTTTTTTTTTTEATTSTTTTTTEPTTTTTTTTTEPTTTTTTTPEPLPYPPPVIEDLTRCPPDSIFFESQCRKIVCSEGEYYAGRCISSACPPGTVWYGKRCQEPGYITTILEIANVIHNEHKYSETSENINRVEYVTTAPYDPDKDKTYDFSTPPNEPDNAVAPPTTTTRRPWIYPSLRPTTEQSVVDEPFPGRSPGEGCCFLKSPRICINYAPNWVCSSREKKLCDPRVCTAPVVYLKPPKIVYDENTKRVVMPPNPPLLACSTAECKESEVLDCSGCKDHQRDKCSPSCYSYYCPNGACAFMKTEDFCALYPGEFGCNARDGCIWDWCTKKCY
ncbi:mucin-2 [Drosophila biarmipes]|uniref:mucin-2 n=1 Tax=Drosophila biarmipes TaxID=125945 RepID=UPI0021CC6D28|nr:mucin-2 [Drosophila biarmipes]